MQGVRVQAVATWSSRCIISLKGGTFSGGAPMLCAALRAASSAFAIARASPYGTPSRSA